MTAANWDLLGHEWAVDMLRQNIIHDNLRHAYLITGPPGVGRRTLALRFAQALNCPQPPEAGEACRTCRTCKQIEAMQYADLTVVQAEKEGGVMKVEQVRQVQHSTVLKPYQGNYRVVLFLRFQEANPNAANALLKTLEEAPAHVVLILTADTPEQLLPTIVSRCELLRLRPLPPEQVAAYLQDRDVDVDIARLVAHISGGRPGVALHASQDDDALALRASRLDDIPTLLAATRQERFAYAEPLAKDKVLLRDTLLTWLAYWRDVFLCAGGAAAPLENIDRSAQIASLTARLDMEAARKIVAALVQAIDRLEKNVNARLLTEVLLLDWPFIQVSEIN